MTNDEIDDIRNRAHAWIGNQPLTRDNAIGEDHMALDMLELIAEVERLRKALFESEVNVATLDGCLELGHRDIDELQLRQQEHFALIAKLSQQVPLESEVAEALNQRGVLLAEIGTLKSHLAAMIAARDELATNLSDLVVELEQDNYLDEDSECAYHNLIARTKAVGAP